MPTAASAKPHLYCRNERWRCVGPLGADGHRAFPWGYGATPAEAYCGWQKAAAQKRPLRKPPSTPTMGDEHAANLGAV